MSAVSSAESLMTLADAAAALSVPESWLSRRVAARAVPHVRLGRYVRFTREQVAEIVASAQEVPPSPLVHGLTRRSHARR